MALKYIKKIMIGILILVAVLLPALRVWQSEWKPNSKTGLQFSAAGLPYTHQYDKDALPFVGSAAIDVNGDGIDELYIGGGRGHKGQFFKFEHGAFTPMNILLLRDDESAVHGAAHLDIDNDGDVDLFTARESGVWLHLNNGNNSFESRKLTIEIASNTVPLSIALGDVNKDGWADLYISGYIKNDLVDGTTNFKSGYGGFSYLLLNNGDNTWRDVSKTAGVWRQHNTFTAVFADLDNDHDSDLIIAQDTGVIEMYENTGAFPMRPILNPSVNSYPMGLALGDYNNDGLVDIYASNVGHTLPAFMLSRKVPKGEGFNPNYYLLRNEGHLQFTDAARGADIARLGFGWGTVFADLNVDGHLDLLAAQNYVKMPPFLRLKIYPSKVMQNGGDGQFSLVGRAAGASNKAFGITPLIADFNGDGKPDIVWVNISGPSRALINQGQFDGGQIIRLPNNARSLGAIISYTARGGKSVSRQIIAGQGLGSDQTRTIFLPPNAGAVTVTYQDGSVDKIERQGTP